MTSRLGQPSPAIFDGVDIFILIFSNNSAPIIINCAAPPCLLRLLAGVTVAVVGPTEKRERDME